METIYKVELVNISVFNDGENSNHVGYWWDGAAMYTMKPLCEIREKIVPLFFKAYEDENVDLRVVYVTQLPIDEEYDASMDMFLSQYVFLPDGTEYIERAYKSDNFKGRETCPLKENDKVFYLTDNGRVYKGIIYTLPIKNIQSDSLDDSYVVLDGYESAEVNTFERHVHVPVVNAFRSDIFDKKNDI